jgi:glycosyltransferase involved in cell wall biosynthesis
MPGGLKAPFSLLQRVKQQSRSAIASIRRRVFKSHFAPEVATIRDSGLFNVDYYQQHYPEFRSRIADAIWHYCIRGWREGNNPSPDFDTQFYLTSNPDILEAGLNPFLHYIVTGKAERRFPNPQVQQAQLEREARIRHAKVSSEVEIIRDSGRFDEPFYASMYPEVQPGPYGLIYHYCDLGWQEGKNPSDEFDSDFYRDIYPDIRDSGINPFLHFVQAGAVELRQARPDFKIRYEDDIWFGLVETDLQFLAFYSSPDWAAFREGRATSVSYAEPPLPIAEFGFYEIRDADILRRQTKLARVHGITGFCFDFVGQASAAEPLPLNLFCANTDIDFRFCVHVDCSRTLLSECSFAGFDRILADPRYVKIQKRPVVLIGVSPQTIRVEGRAWVQKLKRHLQEAGIVKPYLIARARSAGELPAASHSLFDALLDQPAEPVPGETGEFKPIDKNGVGLVPYAIVAAQGISRAGHARRSTFHCITLARHSGDPTLAQPLVYSRFTLRAFRQWLDAAIENVRRVQPPDRRLVFINSWNNWNEGHILEPDRLFGYGRLNEISRAITKIDPGLVMPKVSVIVPNYNHSEFLRQRLDCIYGQTHLNIEVLLLDDCSSDSSRDILDEYARKHPNITTTLYNEHNSGGVFRQWSKGIKAARGDLIWIAESDDYCDTNFLEILVQAFSDESVLLAYAKTVFVDRDQNPLPDGFRFQLLDLPSSHRWLDSYVATAHKEVNQGLGIKNTIPNASGVVFRRPEGMTLLDDPHWLSMRVAGDWVFYLTLICGGKIAFCESTNNYFRRYQGSTAEVAYSQEYFYREVGKASLIVARLYNVPVSIHEQSREVFLRLFQHHVQQGQDKFDEWYGFDSILLERNQRVPAIMVSSMGFYPGGAEILPIRFANELKRLGLSVLFLSAGLHVRENGVRRLLRNDVPVIETADPHATKALIEDFGIEVLNSHQWYIQRYPFLLPDVFSHLLCHAASLHGMIEYGNDFGVSREELLAADRGVTSWVYTADKNLGPFVQLDVLEHSRAHFIKLPNGMEPPEIKPIQRHEIGIPEDAFVLCCVSRAIPEKGWAETVEVVARARAITGKDIRLILVGNGAVYEEFCRSGIPEFVYLAGFSENSVGHYAAADMGIMLTRFKSESFPLTIVDCLFAGKPYLATDVGEIRNILTSAGQVAGEVLPLHDWSIPIETVANALVAYVAKGERYQEAVRLARKIAHQFRIDVVIQDYIKLFQEDVLASLAKRTRDQAADVG